MSKNNSGRPWWVYIVECSDKTLYTGITPNVDERLKKHNAGKGAIYTRGRTPVKLVYSKKLANKAEAAKEEYAVKQLTRQQKIKIIKLNKI